MKKTLVAIITEQYMSKGIAYIQYINLINKFEEDR